MTVAFLVVTVPILSNANPPMSFCPAIPAFTHEMPSALKRIRLKVHLFNSTTQSKNKKSPSP